MDLLLFQLVAFFGLYLHWVKKRTRNQTLSSFRRYMMNHKTHSIKTIISIFSSIVALYAIGDIEVSRQYLAICFGIGFSLDSTLNKSPEE